MRRIPLRRRDGTVRAYATVDDEDYEWLRQWRWNQATKGYAVRRDGKRMVLMHRVVLGLEDNDPRQGDHVNRKRADNRRENLRVAARGADNSQNLGVQADNTSGYRGVSFHKSTGKWEAYAKLNGRRHHLGLHDTPEDANDMVVAWRALHMPFSEDAVAA